MKKKYTIGFLKGSFITFLSLIIILVSDNLLGDNKTTGAVLWMISVGLVIWGVYKKQMIKAWVLVSIFLGILVLPFFCGSLETKSYKF